MSMIGMRRMLNISLSSRRGPFSGPSPAATSIGGFQAYEKAHAKALAATLAKKFPAHIPEEIFPRVVAFWAHAGFYASAAAVAAPPRAAETTNPASWSWVAVAASLGAGRRALY